MAQDPLLPPSVDSLLTCELQRLSVREGDMGKNNVTERPTTRHRNDSVASLIHRDALFMEMHKL